jgi:hypothetical protein
MSTEERFVHFLDGIIQTISILKEYCWEKAIQFIGGKLDFTLSHYASKFESSQMVNEKIREVKNLICKESE